MKRFRVPLVDLELRVHSGDTGIVSWERETGHQIGGHAGMYSGGHLWVHDLCDEITLAHALSHAVDDIMRTLHSDDEEFRA